MAYLETVPEAEASGLVAEQYQASRDRVGYVANYVKAFSLRPEAYRAWGQLIGSIAGNMDLRRYELVTLAAALALRSSYCSLAHGKVLSSKVFDAATVVAIAKDHANAGLPAAEVAIFDFARKVTRQPHEVTEGDISELRGHGLSDAEILDVVLAVGARNFFSRVLDAVGAAPDAAYAELDAAMQEQLCVGRPIESAGQEAGTV